MRVCAPIILCIFIIIIIIIMFRMYLSHRFSSSISRLSSIASLAAYASLPPPVMRYWGSPRLYVEMPAAGAGSSSMMTCVGLSGSLSSSCISLSLSFMMGYCWILSLLLLLFVSLLIFTPSCPPAIGLRVGTPTIDPALAVLVLPAVVIVFLF
jgi:hypothetical protein